MSQTVFQKQQNNNTYRRGSPIKMEILVGWDNSAKKVRRRKNQNPEVLYTQQDFPHYYNRFMIRYVNITTLDSDRGMSNNGAGGIRNTLIKQYAQYEWMVMIDDDDILSPHYLEWLELTLMEYDQKHRSTSQQLGHTNGSVVDLVQFRMSARFGKQIPPLPQHDDSSFSLILGQVGISFAVRRHVFLSQQQHGFIPGPFEDFDFLFLLSRDSRYKMILSSCLAYHVKHALPPSSNDNNNNCASHFFPRVQVDIPSNETLQLVRRKSFNITMSTTTFV